MSGAQALPRIPRALGPRDPSRLPRTVRARLRASSLDRRLAVGTPPWESPLLAARALQLTCERRRRSLARSLERLADRAEQAPSRGFSTVVPVARSQVREASSTISSLAARMRDGRPLDARGVARLLALLCDGSGPLFVYGPPGALDEALKDAYRGLDVND
jgi:hypothetical protein